MLVSWNHTQQIQEKCQTKDQLNRLGSYSKSVFMSNIQQGHLKISQTVNRVLMCLLAPVKQLYALTVTVTVAPEVGVVKMIFNIAKK